MPNTSLECLPEWKGGAMHGEEPVKTKPMESWRVGRLMALLGYKLRRPFLFKNRLGDIAQVIRVGDNFVVYFWLRTLSPQLGEDL